MSTWGAGFLQPWRRVCAGLPGLLPHLLIAAVCAGYATGAAFGWGSSTAALFMGDFGLSAAALCAAVSCFWYVRTGRGVCPSAWLLFAASSTMLGLGNAVWGWYEVVLREPVPQPSAADFCFLLFAPLAIIGLLVLARRPVSRAGWVCLGLDTWLIGGSLLTLSWSLALAHTTYWQDESVFRAALSLAYPLLDIVLVSMVLALHFRRSSANRSAVNTAIGALALTVLCDALFTSPLLREHYRSGQLLDAGWFAGSMLLAYAPWGAGRSVSPPSPRESPGTAGTASGPIAGSLAAITPYLAAGVCTLGLLYHALAGREIDQTVLFTGCTVVLALVIRQGIMLLDNISLTQELAQKENHFRSLVQGSSDVIMIAAPTGVLRYVSPAAAGVYGREADGLIGSRLAGLIHSDDLGRVLHEVRRFLAASPAEEPSTRIECRFRHGSGGWLHIESTVNRYQGGLIFNSRDVTERVQLQAQLQHSASHDSLTDLPNRALFTERVGQALSGRRSGDRETAVLFIDLDGFKAVNDSVGHQAGDELLVYAARRLRESVRAGDTAARLGGDEFAALILGDCVRGHTEGAAPGAADREYRIREIADRLRMTLSQPYRIDGRELRVAASIGVAFAEPGISPVGLMRNADLAMYRAKRAGKNRVELYTAHMQADVLPPAGLASRVCTSGQDGDFILLHQPVIELASGRISAVAACLRKRCSSDAPTSNAAFPTAEVPCRDPLGHSTGPDDRPFEATVRQLGEAVEQAVQRRAAGFPAPVTVRLSAQRLNERSMGQNVVEALVSQHRLPSGSLVLELTQCDVSHMGDELERRLTSLRRLGVVISLDGFSCGSFQGLRRLPADVVRLDRALIEDIAESRRVWKITAGLVRIAVDLGLATIAEGVDRPEQAGALAALGCTYGRGMAFSGPIDERQLRRVLTQGAYPVSPSPHGTAEGTEPYVADPRSMVVAGSMPIPQVDGKDGLPSWEVVVEGPNRLTHAPFEPT